MNEMWIWGINWWNVTTTGKPKSSEKYLYYCLFYHRESHTTCPGIEPQPPSLFLFTPFATCRIETFVSFARPHLAKTNFVCSRKVLEYSVLAGVRSYIHYLFLFFLFLGHYLFIFFLAFVCFFCVNMRRTSILFCNLNVSAPVDVLA
jgi:hypothetical protein